MSIVTMPRRVETRPKTRERTKAAHGRSQRVSLWSRLASRSLTAKLSVIALAALLVIMAGNSYAAQRQVQIHTLQTQLLAEQARYANQVARLTDLAAPARVAAQAGSLHLVVPSSVAQIAAVPLNVPLPTPTLRGSSQVQPRRFQ